MMTPKMLHLLTAVLLRLTLAAGEDVSTLTRLEQSRLSNGAEGEDDGNRDWRAIIEDEDEVDWAQTIIVDNPPLASLQSTFQNIEVFNSDHFGKVRGKDVGHLNCSVVALCTMFAKRYLIN